MKMDIKQFIPPVLISLLKDRGKYGWKGNYRDWQSAIKNSRGYSDLNILNKVKEATLKVKNGLAVYERDSVLFDEIEYSWPLLGGLMWIATQNDNTLKVLDFGGSLGSSYFQNKKFIDGLHHVEWNIVEQESFVHAGRECVEDGIIHFFYSIQECINRKGRPDVLILACTLPYIERPYELLRELMSFEIPYIMIDNTFFNFENRDRITIQHVPPSIYLASYPCWFLSYEKVKKTIAEKYAIVSEHKNDSNIFLDGRSIQYKGFLAKII